MPSYVILGNYTEQGIKNMKDTPTRLQNVKQQMEAVGGRMIAYYLTLGAYDFLAIAEYPDAETGARMAISLNAQGNVRTTTMQAFTEEETARIVQGLP